MSLKLSQNFAVFVPEKCHLSQKKSQKILEWPKKDMSCMRLWGFTGGVPSLYLRKGITGLGPNLRSHDKHFDLLMGQIKLNYLI